MAKKIFVNYRRDDERAMAARIRDRLAQAFGATNVFMDVDNLMAGQRFDLELNKALGQTDVLIAVIGQRWTELLTARHSTGDRDYVREEIAAALAAGIVVIPALIEHATLPRPEALPADIRNFVFHHKHHVTHEKFGRDVNDLIEAIKFIRKAKRSESSRALNRSQWMIIGSVLMGAAAIASAFFFPRLEPSTADNSEVVGRTSEPSVPGLTVITKKEEPKPDAKVLTEVQVDRELQTRRMWVSVKQEFPDWYQARVAEVVRLSADNKDQNQINRYLISEFVTLRRENAKYALSASTTRHKELAAAFLATLNELSKESGDGCYDFISKGEASATIVSRLDDPAKSVELEAQVIAIVGAIVEGKTQPAEHASPVKADYDVLAGELGRLGWTQADMQLFANPKALAKAPHSRVCSMLKDWFTAHLAIQDPGLQGRLLFETLKPVISG